MKPKVIALAGPSATGKSALAVKIAHKFNAEVISADSRYVYKYLDIASAKPSEIEMGGIKHHLIDICEVTEDYSVGRFVKDANECINLITAKGKIPIVTGGTGLYFRALRGTFDIPEVLPDYEFRKQAESISAEVLYEKLNRLSPEIAEKIHPNNKRKVIRALEIAHSNKKPVSKDCPYDMLWLCTNARDRSVLYDKAEKRADEMFSAGLLNEAKSLFEKYGKNNVLMNTIGIKEFYDVIFNDGGIDFAKNEMKKNTRHYIKRQISWFKYEKDLNFLYVDDGSDFEKKAFSLIEEFLNKTQD